MSVFRVDHLPQLDGCQTLTVQVSMLRHCVRPADLSHMTESRPSDISLDSLLAEQQVMHTNSFSVQVCACCAACFCSVSFRDLPWLARPLGEMCDTSPPETFSPSAIKASPLLGTLY